MFVANKQWLIVSVVHVDGYGKFTEQPYGSERLLMAVT